MNETKAIQYLEVCSDMIHKAATRKARQIEDGDGLVVVPVTVCLLVAVDREGGGNVIGSTVRIPVGAPADKMADVLRRSAEAVEQITDTDDEGTHHFTSSEDGTKPLKGEKFDA